MATSSHCPHCRHTNCDSSARSYTDGITLAAYHHARGIRQTQCPGCGLWRWPWEYLAPEMVATGMRWKWDDVDGEWMLCRSGYGAVGYAMQSRYPGKWVAIRVINWRNYNLVDMTESLAAAARALVASVQRG